ncbi:MAG: FAD-dependent oxidoreductase [Gemmatimonadota bacterium]
MARVVILGGGISGHTAAAFLKRRVGRHHDVVVVTPNSRWNWIPSNIWVGVGRMAPEEVTFPLAPVYERLGVEYHQARALSIHPEGDAGTAAGYVLAENTNGRSGEIERIPFDFLVNATGPRLNFHATPGLGPDQGHSLSVCTPGHAVQAAQRLEESMQRMEKGERQTFVVGTGHGGCTCEGAAFEYVFNVEHTIRERGLRDKADILYLTNEYELGDFGVGGLHLRQGGYVVHSRTFAESLYAERGVGWITRTHVEQVDADEIHYETLDGEHRTLPYDFTMLIPPFSGVGLKTFDRSGDDITDRVFAPNGFMKVDADYEKKPFDAWRAADWPRIYQNPVYPRLFATGIAFAPPHPISKPFASPRGTNITPAPPRTGMPSAVIGRAVAGSIADMLMKDAPHPTHHASMAEMGAACVASAGASLLRGSAAALTVFPIVPDYQRYPTYGRDLDYTWGEIGLGAHWIKHLLHHMFLWKAKARPGWHLIPE